MAAVKTVGVSPKVTVPSSLLGFIGIFLAVLAQSGIIVVDDVLWEAVIGAAAVAFGGGYAASPGKVVEK